MKNLLFSLALMLMTTFAFANTNEIMPIDNQMDIHSIMNETDADKAATCKVTVNVGNMTITITVTCECTTKEACDKANSVASLPWAPQG